MFRAMSKTAARLLFPVALFLGACQAIQPLLPPPPEELDLWADAAAGVTDPELARLCTDVWQASLRHDPFQATYLGDPRYNGKIPDTSREARLAWKETLQGFLGRTRLIERRGLGDEDALTVELLHQELDDQVAAVDLGFEDWSVDPLEGPHLRILNVAAVQPCSSARERAQLVERWHDFDSYVRQAARNLEYGLVDRKVATRAAVQKSIEQLEQLLALSPFDSPLLAPATGGSRWVVLPPGGNVAALAHEYLGDAREQSVLLRLNRHLLDPKRIEVGTRVLLPDPGDALTIEERGEFVSQVLGAIEEDIYPALARYHDVLSQKILPAARDDEQVGLKFLPGGLAAYRDLIHRHTSLPLEECEPKDIHEYGLAEVRRIRAEIAALGQRALGTSDLAAIQQRLRSDPALHFKTREEIVAKARESLFRARARLSGTFGLVPRTACEVLPVPAYEEKDATIAYYREPSADGSRPGRYYVNTYEPETRPRYEAEVLAFHEAVPGHHLQIAIAAERDDLPRFRRHLGCTAFVEGWALYTERLCDEMGLYSGDLDRLGMLSYDAWRACRLVVDTGIHAFGWSREQAIDYLLANTLLARNNIENEVDRYIAWPGQALAYKIGQRELLALRDQARKAQGASFSYPRFHDRVLENGALTLPSLRRQLGGAPAREIEAGAARQ